MRAMKLILYLALSFLAGCGDFEWLPDNSKQSVALGPFISSERGADAKAFTTIAQRGVFHTYTSLRVPVGTPVTLKRTLTPDGKVTGQMLIALDQAVLVQDVVTVAE